MKSPIEITFTFLGNEYRAKFWKNNYIDHNNLYVGILTWDEEYEDWEPWSDLTVNLGVSCEPNKAFIDTNNCADAIINILTQKGYIKETGILRPSGSCIYPMYEFSEEFLNGMEG